MAKKIFGLDISDRSIEALVLTKTLFGKVKISSYARTLMPAGIVNNGQIKNPEKLAIKISELLSSAQPKPIKTQLCILSIPESQVFTTIFKLPAGLKKREIINTIPYQAEEVIPFKAGEIYFDFKTISKNESTQDIFYIAVPMSVIDAYIDVLNKINLKPLAFDLESISSSRALLANAKKDEANFVIDIGMRTTSLNIFQNQSVRQSLHLSTAGNHITRAIAKGLGLSPKDAEKLKHRLSFTPKTDQEKQAIKYIEKEIKKIINAAKKIISFFETESHIKVQQVTLIGGTSLIPGLDQYFADQLKVKVDVGKPWQGIANAPDVLRGQEKEEILFANVTGLAARGLLNDPVNGDINLLPIKPKSISLVPKKDSHREWKSIYIQFAFFGFLVFAFIALFIYRQQVDILQRFFPSNVPKSFESSYDPLILEELRSPFFDQASSTASSTDQIATTTDLKLPTSTQPQVQTPTSSASSTKQIFAPAPNIEEKVKIKPTTLGYLNVRQGPGVSYPKVGQAEVGKIYNVVSEKNGWFEIRLDLKVSGWVISTYAEKQ